MAYCASGPYKHVAGLLERDPMTWIPWGYSRHRIAAEPAPALGSEFELWEIDDVREPRTARCVSLGTVDFVQSFHDYTALTLRCRPGSPSSTEDEVLLEAGQGRLAFLSSAGRKDPVKDAQAVSA